MAKRKSFIELQSKPQNREVRNLLVKPKPVRYAPLNVAQTADGFDNGDSQQNDTREGKSENQKGTAKNAQSTKAENGAAENQLKINDSETQNAGKSEIVSKNASPEKISDDGGKTTLEKRNEPTGQERLRIFQTSSPHTRAVTQYHKAAIVVRSEGGRQTIELTWRDQMNEKTRDIWDYLVKRFNEAAKTNANEILIRKRDVLENSGVKSDRTFISAIYTLEDMKLIRVRRLSGNKEGNVYILTEEGREEIESYRKL